MFPFSRLLSPCFKWLNNSNQLLRKVSGVRLLFQCLGAQLFSINRCVGTIQSQSVIKMDSKALSHYMFPLDQSVMKVDCTQAFNGLTDKEKRYAYYLCQASWVGGLIVNVQASPESPAIFSILHDIFKTNGIDGLKSIAVGSCDFTDDEWQALVVYTGGIFCNMGNYKGYGDTKFIPGLPLNKLQALVNKAQFHGHKHDEVLQKLDEIKDKVYSLTERERQLGLGDKGITTYFSSNCTNEDSELINRFLKKQNLESWITRCFKTTEGGSVNYEIRSASAESDAEKPEAHVFENCNITLTRGDYSSLLKKVSNCLLQAKEHAANETEQKMLEEYVKSFTEGSLDAHKEGSRYWIKNKEPIVETYIGFIETYKDPAGTRGEFRGFVSVVNRPMSAKFQKLVDQAEQFLPLLPWPKDFEKDTFLKPDFTSLDVFAFSGSKIPGGTNVPNYDSITQTEGFKNFSFGNVLSASDKDPKIPYLGTEDREILIKYGDVAYEVQVGLHELLGHGSGKIFQRQSDGSTNFPSDLMHPFTKDLLEGCYEPGETYGSVFSTMASAYEECRADCVGLLLCMDKTVLKIFGHEGAEADTVVYANWLSELYFGTARALIMYQPDQQAWMQAHSQAGFVILNVLIEAGEGLVTIEEKVGTDGKPDLEITLDRSKIDTVGRKAMTEFLMKLQVYKATADIKSAKAMFEKYSEVNDDGPHPWLKWRDILMEKRKPRKLTVLPNLVMNDGDVQLKCYDPTIEGLIQSWIDRFDDLSVYNDLEECRQLDKPFFSF